jgi:hypothetical protein
MRVAVEPHDKLDRAMSGGTTAASACDLCFPIGLFLVEAARGFSALRDRRPGLVRAGHMGNEAAGRNGNLAVLRWIVFCHAEAAGLFRGGGKVRWSLSVGSRQWSQAAEKQNNPEGKR